MAIGTLNLRIGGMESRKDVQLLQAILESLPGIEAYDVKTGKVRLSYDSKKVELARVFQALAEAGEGYDVELD